MGNKSHKSSAREESGTNNLTNDDPPVTQNTKQDKRMDNTEAWQILVAARAGIAVKYCVI